MTETRYPGQELQDEILKTVRKSQEAVIDAIKAWADTVQSITPKLPAVNPPFADKLPKPEEVVANAYDFAEQLLAYIELERGLHQPSVRVLKLISDALNVSAETLLAEAGLITPASPDQGETGSAGPPTEDAIRADERLSEDQKSALIAVYRSMLPPG